MARTIDCIYLRPCNNLQGGHKLMDLNSRRVVTWYKVTEIPVTELIVQAVEKLAKNEGFKGIKFTN